MAGGLLPKTQLGIYSQLESLAEEHHRAMWGTQEFYGVFSLVNGGRRRETDLFEGCARKSVSVRFSARDISHRNRNHPAAS